MNTDAEATAAALGRAAKIHAQDLAGFVTLGYDTPGYGQADKNPDGTPLLLARTGGLAAEHGVPYVCDNAWGWLGSPRGLCVAALCCCLLVWSARSAITFRRRCADEATGAW